MESYDITLSCTLCKKKVGVLSVMTVGSPHQFVNGIVCMNCLPKAIEKARKSARSNIRFQARINMVEKWLKEGDKENPSRRY